MIPIAAFILVGLLLVGDWLDPSFREAI